MPVNLEIKVKVSNLLEIKNIALSINAKYSESLRQIDTYFHVAHGRLKLREINESHAELIYYDREESFRQRLSSFEQYPTKNPSLMKRLLIQACGMRGIISKRREVFLLNNDTRIHFDEVDGLGEFIEFEIPAIDLDLARKKMEFLIKQFRIRESDFIRPSYIDLMILSSSDTR